MISAIDAMDVVEARATPLSHGVIFTIPAHGVGVLMMASLGCAAGAPDELPQVSVGELRRQVMPLDFFGYRGCDFQYHYFAMPGHRGLRVPREDLIMDRLPLELGLCLFVSFRCGTLSVPEPLAMVGVDPADCAWALDW